MKKLLSIFTCVVIFGMAGTSFASFYVDPYFGDELLEAGESTTWSFDLLNDTLYGIDIDGTDLTTIDWSSIPYVDINAGDTITSAYFSLWIGDDNLLGDAQIDTGWFTMWLGDEYEYGEAIADGTVVFPEQEISIIDGVFAYDLTVELQDYTLSVTITNTGDSGDFVARLAAVGGEFSSVPEPTTMLLFGAGLAGLAGVSRRRKN